ncbi:hypothetical protein SAMN05444161_3465 [Rhizobiales bacterium GAS191]|jgi:hypothetical protein|nr:hypothetical protein SAMN05519103_02633 [Rhizobiales bacterium GAS113]SED55657.1 hypothetical protein SAMN05444161_3465 [Rhizobiales bacterium GAS191]SEE79508.1 hypothetical protein SAMN05519104_7514 [Rhizobiales bacterium GAS188]
MARSVSGELEHPTDIWFVTIRNEKPFAGL